VHQDRNPEPTQRGFTIIELAAAMVLLMLGLATLSASIVNSLRLGAVNRETALILDRTRELEAQISAVPFDEIFRRFNVDPADDPGGAGTALGARFTFPDWEPWDDDYEAPHGAEVMRAEVRLPIAPGAGGLRETANLPEFGFPRDLDGDGIDGRDHSSDYLILPMTIHLEWNGVTGPRSFDLDLLLRE
jgi:hypothetical protein